MKDVAKIVAALSMMAVWAALVFGPLIAIGWVVIHFIGKWW